MNSILHQFPLNVMYWSENSSNSKQRHPQIRMVLLFYGSASSTASRIPTFTPSTNPARS